MSYSLPPYLEPSISKVTQMLLTRSSAIQFRGVSILQSGGYAIYYGGVTSFVLPGPNDPLERATLSNTSPVVYHRCPVPS